MKTWINMERIHETREEPLHTYNGWWQSPFPGDGIAPFKTQDYLLCLLCALPLPGRYYLLFDENKIWAILKTYGTTSQNIKRQKVLGAEACWPELSLVWVETPACCCCKKWRALVSGDKYRSLRLLLLRQRTSSVKTHGVRSRHQKIFFQTIILYRCARRNMGGEAAGLSFANNQYRAANLYRTTWTRPA